mmetsp:Transcript_10904/g.15000  ORF Transcript_10904/g.15000 Transcript_10904/m.15000 type:complete len:247 (-) Transcript_10904:1206-1946(-)
MPPPAAVTSSWPLCSLSPHCHVGNMLLTAVLCSDAMPTEPGSSHSPRWDLASRVHHQEHSFCGRICQCEPASAGRARSRAGRDSPACPGRAPAAAGTPKGPAAAVGMETATHSPPAGCAPDSGYPGAQTAPAACSCRVRLRAGRAQWGGWAGRSRGRSAPAPAAPPRPPPQDHRGPSLHRRRSGRRPRGGRRSCRCACPRRRSPCACPTSAAAAGTRSATRPAGGRRGGRGNGQGTGRPAAPGGRP